ncbi:peptide ABC transporter substrate-binding protein [Bradyrhizobium canariense]|uniref:Peptide ABC transporter substrate-binding protein n=1 Tax=Bradyrhizobium canariense TaxID=255045 RepID=A0ABX3X4J0_9BRAD|nr:ABC transporter substrate-binding protein [Bradyrhizobium canariense]OSJ13562.1 peptide ABC transporter substrate-binding protein [Bradyrhizobium canariense]OSJ28777.1 peptide ABC transporter substrate-binding protein [Bradyrhizobium canariense]
MSITRRTLVKGSMAAMAAGLMPLRLRAQTAQSAARTVRMATGNITIFDPYSTTAIPTMNHALAIYDMLFALDSQFAPQPQMVSKWSVSDDKKTYTFELRDGLAWHDGTHVTAADCVASIRRWLQLSGAQSVRERAKDISKKDENSFRITLNEPLGQLIDQLGNSQSPLFVMREQDADRPPSQPVTTHIGSGPFKFNERLFKPGSSLVYDRNEEYVPRREKADGLAGGKVAKVDRIICEIMKNAQTAAAALQAGEVDFLDSPPAEVLSMLENDPNLVVEDLHKSGDDYVLRMNCLQAPFSNAYARQAMLHLIDQEAFLNVMNRNPKYNHVVTSLFGTNTPYVNDVNTGWHKKGGDPEKAKQLFQKAGYAGEKLVILQPTDWAAVTNASQLLAATLRKIGINVELAPSDWAGLIARRDKRGRVEDGGWSMFITYSSDASFGRPSNSAWLALNGENGWYGWPTSDEYEALRAKWPDLETLEDRRAMARKMQQVYWDSVGQVFLGQINSLTARRKTLTGIIGAPALTPMWNMQKS